MADQRAVTGRTGSYLEHRSRFYSIVIMVINLIRHSYTEGNLRSAYIGSTDEPLCGEGVRLIAGTRYPECTVLAASPMKRCIETAGLIYGTREIITVRDFRECDFGSFEGKNYLELGDDAGYRDWVESGGRAAFPGGEDPESFSRRCADAFRVLVSGLPENEVLSLVVHGGTIMSIMERYALPHKSFFEWHVRNGCGYICDYADGSLRVTGYIG